MDDKLKWVLAAIGALMLWTLYESYQVPPSGGTTETYTYTVEVTGPGYVTPTIGGTEKATLRHQTKEFTDIEPGTYVTLLISPEQGAKVLNARNEDLTITSNTTAEVSFTAVAPPESEHPYGLSDDQWNLCSDKVQNALESPGSWMQAGLWPWWKGNEIRFGFPGWFNDIALEWGDRSRAQYAEQIADLIKQGDDVINRVIALYYAPIGGTPVEKASPQKILDRFDKVRGG